MLRRLGLLAALWLGASCLSCSGSSGASAAVSPTLVTLSPSAFRGEVACGPSPGAWKTYVATLTDVTDPAQPFTLPSSGPVPCHTPVSFSFVVPGHAYVASVDAYDTADMVPLGGRSSGSPHMLDIATGADVAPRWRASCGAPLGTELVPDAGLDDAQAREDASEAADDASGQDGADDAADTQPEAAADAEAAGGEDAGLLDGPGRDNEGAGGSAGMSPTFSYLHADIQVHDCSQLQEVLPARASGISLDLGALSSTVGCGNAPGQAATFRVVVPGLSDEARAARCDEVLRFEPLQPGSYLLLVEGFESEQSMPRWFTTCAAAVSHGVVEPAVCEPLSERGAVRIPIGTILSAAARRCDATDVREYRATLLGAGLRAVRVPCATDAVFGPLNPAVYQALVDAVDATDRVVATAFCEASVRPGTTVTAECAVAPVLAPP